MTDETSSPANSASAATAPQEKYPWRALVLLLLLTALVRGGVLWLMPEGLSRDPDGYRDLAWNLAFEGTYAKSESRHLRGMTWQSYLVPTAARSPLYSLVLSNWTRGSEIPPDRVALLHWLLGLATVALTWHMARLWNLQHLAFFAALLVACDPILLKQSAEVLTETLATFLAVLSLYSLTRFHLARTPFNAGLAGGALALAELCRPTFLVWLVLVLVAVPCLRTTRWRRLANACAFVIVAAMIIAPWGIRNYVQFGSPIITSTHGGNTFVLSNNREFYAYLSRERAFIPWSIYWASDHGENNDVMDTYEAMVKVRIGSPTEAQIHEDRLYYQYAFSRIRENPGMFAYSCIYRLRRLWALWPYPTETPEPATNFWLRQATAAWYAALWICALAGTYTLGRRLVQSPWLWGTLLVVSITGVHTFYWTDLRMRAPLMPFLALLAAVGTERLLAFLRPLLLARRASEGR